MGVQFPARIGAGKQLFLPRDPSGFPVSALGAGADTEPSEQDTYLEIQWGRVRGAPGVSRDGQKWQK